MTASSDNIGDNRDKTEAGLPLWDCAAETERNFKRAGTSSDAAAEAAKKAPYWRGKVLQVLRKMDLTADEIAAQLNADILTIRPRCSELFRGGLIEPSGLRRKTPRGRTADVWRLRQWPSQRFEIVSDPTGGAV